jgi:hypothetical protein
MGLLINKILVSIFIIHFLIYPTLAYNNSSAITSSGELKSKSVENEKKYPYTNGDLVLSLNAGYLRGIEDEIGVSGYDMRQNIGYFFSNNIGIFLEIHFESFFGNASNGRVDSSGFSGSWLLQWHFLSFEWISFYLEYGLGLFYGFKEFPPGGTRLNGISNWGGGFALVP